VTNLGLTDSVNATEALLKPVLIPLQIVVHHPVSTLEVDALSSGIGSEKHLYFGIVKKGFLRFSSLLSAHPAMDHHYGAGAAEQRCDLIVEIIQRVAVFGEQHQFLTW
jgi:hypothetical protein